MVELLCLLNGEASRKAFPVNIKMNKTVGELKNAIRLAHPVLKTYKLTLWRVSIPKSLDIIQYPPRILQREQLPHSRKLRQIFTQQPVKGHVHIIIEPPQSQVSLKRTPQAWFICC